MNDLAYSFVEQNKFGDAQTLYEQIVHRFPDYPEAHYNWGLSFAKQGRYAEAADQTPPGGSSAHRGERKLQVCENQFVHHERTHGRGFDRRHS